MAISRSLIGSCLDCRVHEVTLPTHNREVFFVTSAMCGRALSWRMSDPDTSNWGRFMCIFLIVFAPRGSRNVFTCCTTIFFKSICHKLHIFFFNLLMFSASLVLGHCSMLTQPPWKWLAQWETVLQSTVNSPQTSLKALWISVGFLPCKVWS